MLRLPILLGSALALLSGGAFAHYPTLDCKQIDQSIQCVAAYSDGSVAFNETVQALTYEDELITSLTTDDSGMIRLPTPSGEYYLLFDPGHEDPAEFDYAEF
ncbi:hypothetical protein [Marinomonas algarum]|uniref:Carboxypeptidase regulatory-like domain-containing protein n=1 Tax=Marinomonas algarum TaxID=2883105 RepID=A0A9X1INL5_9GAMM|nr:hypothetical protein [Marinomonas algarum]MCB5161078.1 hypothetical protein [Marinomonas algarum]